METPTDSETHPVPLTRLFSYDDARDANETVYELSVKPPLLSKFKWTNEFIAAAAGFEALKYYENHLINSDELPPRTCAEMNELLTQFATAEVDKIFQIQTLHHGSPAKTKILAAEQARMFAKQKYGGGTGPEG
ncbi:hypothetical protein BV898_04104 [Hypsibius exemplaris]|uniref:Uncharacterized protein n=1 Tax=Hypsibius exemplaris TaxID=2072580 RepID=A0A1W0X386_HYPEX|nr:hypothetical protein BV898_04104 [Hypsibius exemplaris]